MGFAITTFVVCAILFFVFFFPRNIIVGNGILKFVRPNSYQATQINLSDISHLECSCKHYNTVTVTTKDGCKYQFHPKDAQKFENVVNSGNLGRKP